MNAYQRYTRSPHWRAFRLEAIKNAGGKCSLCQTTDNLVVHHKHYETLGKETFDDVEVLCSKCHMVRQTNSGYTTIDFNLIRALDGQSLKLYLLLKMDAQLNYNGEYSMLPYGAMCTLLNFSKGYVVALTQKLIDEYKLIIKVRTKTVNKYYFTHPDEWDLQL